MESDPTGLAAGLNPYAYAGNDPINSVDPSGLIARVVNGNWVDDGLGFDGSRTGNGFTDQIADQMPSAISGVVTGGVIGSIIQRGLAAFGIYGEISLGAVMSPTPVNSSLMFGYVPRAIAEDSIAEIALYGPYYRYGDSALNIQSIKESGLLFGNRGANYMYTPDPFVKAYTADFPKPPNPRGFEFFTPAKPSPGGSPGQPTWRLGSPGVTESGEKAVIKCVVTSIFGC